MRVTTVQVGIALILAIHGSVLAADLSDYEKTCSELGFKVRTPAYGECVLELDRRSTARQRQSDRPTNSQQPLDQQRTQTDQFRQQQEQQRATQAAAQGDGTPDHHSCYRYGFVPGTPFYAECRMRIDMARKEAAQKQAAYEADSRRYEEQMVAIEKEKERQKNLKLLEFSARLLGTTSPNFGQAVGNAATGTIGGAVAQPSPPTIQNFTIRSPSGGMMYCTYTNNFMSCR